MPQLSEILPSSPMHLCFLSSSCIHLLNLHHIRTISWFRKSHALQKWLDEKTETVNFLHKMISTNRSISFSLTYWKQKRVHGALGTATDLGGHGRYAVVMQVFCRWNGVYTYGAKSIVLQWFSLTLPLVLAWMFVFSGTAEELALGRETPARWKSNVFRNYP